MLYKFFKVNETSKRSAFRVAIYNLFLTIILTILLLGFISIVFQYYEEEKATHVGRLIWVEAILNTLFLPFSVVLAVGVKKDNYKFISIWIQAKVVQASYIFLLNLVIQVYISVALNIGDGVIVLVYTLIIEILYTENIMYMHNYRRHLESQEKSINLEGIIPDTVVVKF